MFTSLEIFQSAHGMAKHAAHQQAVVSKNIAHADTPGFKAMILPERSAHNSFNGPSYPMQISRQMHMPGFLPPEAAQAVIDENAAISPNGNSVSIEQETLKSIEAERAHSRAMTVYQNALSILRTSIGRGR